MVASMAEGSPLKQGMAGITLTPRSDRGCRWVAPPRVRVNPRRMVSSLCPYGVSAVVGRTGRSLEVLA